MSNSTTNFTPNLKATNIITIKTINKEKSNVIPAIKYNLSSLLKRNAMEQAIDIKCSGKTKFDDEISFITNRVSKKIFQYIQHIFGKLNLMSKLFLKLLSFLDGLK